MVVDLIEFVFFFQAEDGIRDVLGSRGLGDVYKRQLDYRGMANTGLHTALSWHSQQPEWAHRVLLILVRSA